MIEEVLQWRVDHLRRMGFTAGWRPSHNVELYGDTVLALFPDIGGDDFCWLCNRLAAMWKKCDKAGGCVDNIRLSRDPKSDDYIARQERGCCGFHDERVVNPKTGTAFWLGCNYGH